jgi:hypothetical protein
MEFELFHQWIHQIYTTQDEELDCNELLDTIPRYVDVEIAGGATDPHFPGVETHLGHCPQCQDLYLTLREAALLENQQIVLEDQPVVQPFSSGSTADGVLQPDAPASVPVGPLTGEIPR